MKNAHNSTNAPNMASQFDVMNPSNASNENVEHALMLTSPRILLWSKHSAD